MLQALPQVKRTEMKLHSAGIDLRDELVVGQCYKRLGTYRGRGFSYFKSGELLRRVPYYIFEQNGTRGRLSTRELLHWLDILYINGEFY